MSPIPYAGQSRLQQRANVASDARNDIWHKQTFAQL